LRRSVFDLPLKNSARLGITFRAAPCPWTGAATTQEGRRPMRKYWILAVLLALGGSLSAAELVGVPGSGTKYPSEIDVNAGGKAVKLRLTGTAMRTKVIVNVYALGSYVQQGTRIGSAEELAGADVDKRLHLVMERAVEGKDMAEAFRTAVRMNYPEPTFNAEVEALCRFIQSQTANKGDHILLTHTPGVGLHVNLAGKVELTIQNPAFSRAIWDIYLGPKNLGDGIKKGLVSRQ
jgi:hypothetical protein